MKEYLTMSNREIDRLKVIQKVFDKQLTWNEASKQLSLSWRQVARLCAKVREDGNRGIMHGLRGHASNHCLKAGLKEKALKTVKSIIGILNPLLQMKSFPKFMVLRCQLHPCVWP